MVTVLFTNLKSFVSKIGFSNYCDCANLCESVPNEKKVDCSAAGAFCVLLIADCDRPTPPPAATKESKAQAAKEHPRPLHRSYSRRTGARASIPKQGKSVELGIGNRSESQLRRTRSREIHGRGCLENMLRLVSPCICSTLPLRLRIRI